MSSERISNTFAAYHIKAEAKVRGDLDEDTVKSISEQLCRGREVWQTYAKWAEEVLILRQNNPRLDDRTSNALAVYLIRRGQGLAHDAVEIARRFVSQN